MIAAIDFQSPLFWAIMIGWIMSVILHEFAHGIVAHWGGDWTIRERGGLTLNPFQYIDPLMSIIMPAVLLAIGGLPMPGGSTYVRRDLLRSRGWDSAVSLAGPAMNLLIFLACVIPLHPKIGWADYSGIDANWTNGQSFLAAMAILQFSAALFNLVPVPPLDGFQAISPFMDEESRIRLSTPPLSHMIFFGYFLVLWKVPGVWDAVFNAIERVLLMLGFGDLASYYFVRSFLRVVFGHY